MLFTYAQMFCCQTWAAPAVKLRLVWGGSMRCHALSDAKRAHQGTANSCSHLGCQVCRISAPELYHRVCLGSVPTQFQLQSLICQMYIKCVVCSNTCCKHCFMYEQQSA